VDPSLDISTVSSLKYKLTALVIHQGDQAHGHYFSVVKREDQWIIFNDEQIRPIDEDQILEAFPYMLFYE
jgi:ubiquitin C-terminal hydrolase